MSEKMVKILMDLWRKADDRAFKAELRIMELERDCMCPKRYKSWVDERRLNPLLATQAPRDRKK